MSEIEISIIGAEDLSREIAVDVADFNLGGPVISKVLDVLEKAVARSTTEQNEAGNKILSALS